MNNYNVNECTSHSQEIKILSYLLDGNRITSLEALDLFGCFRLASRISSLRKRYDIKDEFTTLRNGKRVKSYWIETA